MEVGILIALLGLACMLASVALFEAGVGRESLKWHRYTFGLLIAGGVIGIIGIVIIEAAIC